MAENTPPPGTPTWIRAKPPGDAPPPQPLTASGLMAATLPISTPQDLLNLSTAMQHPGYGVEVKDRTYHFRRYLACFLDLVGSEATDWIRIRCAISRDEAAKVGQRLMDEKLIHHVVYGEPFRDGFFFYRFQDLGAAENAVPKDGTEEYDLEDIAVTMSSPMGVEAKDRKYLFRTFKNCILGTEAVAWLSDNLKLPKNEAIKVGQRLTAGGYICHVTNDHDLVDEPYYYYFKDIKPDKTLYDFTVSNIEKQPTSLKLYENTVAVVTQLQGLYEKYKDKGFVVLIFPSNQFDQELDDNEDIKEFLKKYKITFPIFDKIAINGDKADPLYKWLKSKQKGVFGTEAIKWNFTKFLINKRGLPVQRYGPPTDPNSMEGDILKLLQS